MSDTVLVERDGAVATLKLNRPGAMNAMNGELLDALVAHGREVADDPSVRCVILTGEGRAFCAGGDIRGMAAAPRGSRDDLVSSVPNLRRREEISRLLAEMPKPTIAAVNGAAAGAGLSIALACDLRVASEQARFTTAFAKVGFSGDFGGTWFLQRLVGPMKAKELYFNSGVLSAQQALDLGVVTRVVPHDSLREEAAALARRLAAGPTLAFARIKDNFAFGASNTLSDALTREAENMTALGRSDDHRNAALAFLEKREPDFHGR